MLLDFTCANYRSIQNKCTLSLLAQGIADEPKNNIALINKKLKVLKTAALYGANSSGKSNIIRAFSTMIKHIIDSVRLNESDELYYDPFQLSTETISKPTFFEVTFTIDDLKYRYGFEYNRTDIVGEWLYSSKCGNKLETLMFLRTEEGIGVSDKAFPEGLGKEQSTVKNRLFLSLCAQLNGELSKKLMDELGLMNVISGIYGRSYAGYSKVMLHQHLKGYNRALDFFKRTQLGFEEVKTVEKEIDKSILPSDLPESVKVELMNELRGKKNIELYTKHNVYDEKGQVVDSIHFDAEVAESDGTNKLIELSGPIFDTLTRGGILWIDELDAKMHPLISQHIVNLFNNPKANPYNAQLVFSTHDTHLLSSRLLRRDQIWFTEKDKVEQTDLYCMMDIELPDGSKPRSDANFKRNYIAGRYGAIPFILND